MFLQLAIDEAIAVNKGKTYMYVLGIGCAWLARAIANHNLLYESALLPAKVKNGLILMIFEKISSLSQNVVEGKEIGKIINMISNDFNMIDGKFVFLMISLSLPIKIVGTSLVIAFRLGWMSLLLFVLIGSIIVFQIFMGKLTSKYLKEINLEKDQRMKVYT